MGSPGGAADVASRARAPEYGATSLAASGLVVQPPPKPCRPCYTYPWKTPYPDVPCPDAYCIGEITVEAVMEVVEKAGDR